MRTSLRACSLVVLAALACDDASRSVCVAPSALRAEAPEFPPGTAPTGPTDVRLIPPDGARFLADQRFDVRVEGRGEGPFTATLAIDGVAHAFASGAQGTLTTDGISAPGHGGFNLRGHSLARAGMHAIEATFTDARGTVRVDSRLEVVDARGARPPVRNVILLVGDGMGAAHRTAARLVRHGARGGDPGGFLAMDGFPATGLVTTHSLDSIVTDSSPGMACYSTGAHAANGQEGVYPAHVVSPFFQPRVEYMAEYLHRTRGMSLGLVTTADVEDATPAANAVHTGHRGAGTGIVDQYLDESDAAGTGRFGTGLRVLMGGGRRWFLPAGRFGSSRAPATDYSELPADLVRAWGLPERSAGAIDPSRDLTGDFVAAGFAFVDSATALTAAMAAARPPERLLGLFAYGNMNVALDKIAKRRNRLLPGARTFAVDDYHAPDQPMLDEMTEAALRVLARDNRRGFVLVVEGAHIDKQSHAMDGERAVGDVLELDRAVAVARRFADEVDPSTLVLVVADHECAGFAILGATTGSADALRRLPADAAATSPDATPARQRTVGVQDQAGFSRYEILPDGYPATFDVAGKLLFGFGANGDRHETWLTSPRPIIDTLLPVELRAELDAAGYPEEPFERARDRGCFVRGQAVGREQAVHTAADVPISAYSPRRRVAEQFVGVQRNIDVFVKILRAVLGGYDPRHTPR